VPTVPTACFTGVRDWARCVMRRSCGGHTPPLPFSGSPLQMAAIRQEGCRSSSNTRRKRFAPNGNWRAPASRAILLPTRKHRFVVLPVNRITKAGCAMGRRTYVVGKALTGTCVFGLASRARTRGGGAQTPRKPSKSPGEGPGRPPDASEWPFDTTGSPRHGARGCAPPSTTLAFGSRSMGEGGAKLGPGSSLIRGTRHLIW
jgi:hypothetical protein